MTKISSDNCFILRNGLETKCGRLVISCQPLKFLTYTEVAFDVMTQKAGILESWEYNNVFDCDEKNRMYLINIHKILQREMFWRSMTLFTRSMNRTARLGCSVSFHKVDSNFQVSYLITNITVCLKSHTIWWHKRRE